MNSHFLKVDGVVVAQGSEEYCVEKAKNYDGDYEILDKVTDDDTIWSEIETEGFPQDEDLVETDEM